MRVLVTGASGFVGGHVSRGLADDGHAVGAVVRTGSDAARIDPRVERLVHDGSTEGMAALVAGFAPDAAVHAASRFVAEHAPADIDALAEANLRFGLQLLDAMSRAGCTALVDFGTSWQHFDPGGEGSGAYNPVSLYAATKQAFQDLVRFYTEARGLRALTLKLSDTYGPDDPRRKLIAVMGENARTGGRLSMSGGDQAFNLVHSDDVTQAVRVALARVLAAPPGHESFAVRGAEQMTLREFIAVFERATGRPVAVGWGERPYRDREVMHPWLGETLPGWSPAVPLEQGLRQVVGDV